MSQTLDSLFGPDPATVMCRCTHSKEIHYPHTTGCKQCPCEGFHPGEEPPESGHFRIWWSQVAGP